MIISACHACFCLIRIWDIYLILIFLDCRELGLNQDQLNRLFVEDAHLALNDGTTFGKEGEGFMRLNIACPRAVLEQALKQLEQAVRNLK